MQLLNKDAKEKSSNIIEALTIIFYLITII